MKELKNKKHLIGKCFKNSFLKLRILKKFKLNEFFGIAIVVFIFVCIIGYNSIALIVSDNDGQAFVTKKEFEVMKEEYDKSIEKYQNSMSDKIEGTILQYLSGKTRWSEYMSQKTPASILSYPLTIYNNEYDITLANWQSATKPLWGPSINHLGIYQSVTNTASQYVTFLFKLNYDRKEKNANTIKNFYNVTEYSTTDGTCCIDSVLDNFNATNSYNEFYCNALNWRLQNNYKLLIRQDQDASPDLNGTNNGEWTVRNEYADLFSSKEFPANTYATAYYNNNTGAITFANNFSKWSGYALYSKAISNATQGLRSKNTVIKEYNKVEALDKVYNINDDNMLFPVAYDTDVYYTNKKSLKEDIKPVATIEQRNYYYNKAYDTITNTVENYITAGWTIEPEGVNAGRNWYNTSLIHAKRVHYKVQLPNSNSTKKQSILKGFIAGDMPSRNLNKGKLEIDVHFENTTNDKYIIMSKNPITESNPNNWTTASDFVNISDSEEGVTSVSNAKVKLKEGKNEIYLTGLESGDVLYYKIIWNPTDTSYVQITSQPVLSYIYL